MQLTTGLVLTGLTLCFAACSDEFEASNAGSKDSGADAGADAADAAGDAGADAPVKCTKDSECDDKDPCNGFETCDTAAGTCLAGSSPCAAPSDPAHCQIVCSNEGGQAKCGSETAKDGDGDGHGDPDCAANPGDDCDDTNKDVHPGATELCDGIDGNCNGVVDIDDGLPLGGSVFDIAAPPGADAVLPQAAWSGDRLGVVWTDFADPFHVHFGLFDKDAKPLVQDFKVSSIHFEATGADIAADTASFGVAFVGEVTGARHVFFRRFDADGKATTGPVQLSTLAVDGEADPRIVSDSGGYLVVWHRYVTGGSAAGDVQYARRVDSAGAASGSQEALLNTTLGPKIWEHDVVVLGSEYAVLQAASAASAIKGTELRLVKFDSQLAPSSQTSVGPKPSFYATPVAVATSGGLAAAWAGLEDLPTFAQLGPTGGFDCGPTPSKLTQKGGVTGGIVALGTSRLVSFVSSPWGASGNVNLLRFDSACAEQPILDVAGGTVSHPDPGVGQGARSDVAVGASKIAVVWDEKVNTNAKIRGRIFGKNLCN